MGSFWSRQYRRAKNFTGENAGKLARGATVAAAGAIGTVACGPVCGVAAAGMTDATLGDTVERQTKRYTDDGAKKASAYFNDPSGAPPPELSSGPTGVASIVPPPGMGDPYSRFEPASRDRLETRDRNREIKRGIVISVTLAAGVAAVGALLRRR